LPVNYIVFFLLAAMGTGSAILMITRRNPISSALWLIANFLALAGIYLTLEAQFLAVMQIVVYAGAIMVLVLFVIMLLNLKANPDDAGPTGIRIFVNIALVVMVLTLITEAVIHPMQADIVFASSTAGKIGTVENIGSMLYTVYMFPFEMTSILLLAALIGAVLLAKRRFP
jgi:NADH-quinone oxidoreductase subunit J